MTNTNSEMKIEKYAFEPFGTLGDLLLGKPIKIMPLGTFYRDDRKLEITPADLKQIENNVNAGLPRFRIPINENHGGIGKIGTVNKVAFNTGTDGEGLYATEYELTDEGKKLIEQKRFDAVSPEMVWKKNGGSQYQDPTTGEYHDNVLVGLALTDRPFFGHDNVALFSAMPQQEKFMAGNMDKLKEMMMKMGEMLKSINDMMGGKEEDEMTAVTKTQEANQRAKEEMPEINQGDNMSDKQEDKTEAFALSAESFKALQEKAGKVDALEAQLKTANTEAEKFRAEFEKEREARQFESLKIRVDNFVALPFKADEFTAELNQLQKASPELFTKIMGRFEALDTALAKTELFDQKASQRTGTTEDTLEVLTEKIVKETFSGDMTKYAEAMTEAAKQRPDLAKAYLNK